MAKLRVIIGLTLITLSRLAAGPLVASVDADTSVSGVYSYTVFNDEPNGSSNYIDSFSILIDAPVTVIGTPAGWAVDTDNLSFVFWYNTDPVLPYPHDIAPGTSLDGFSISSPGAVSVLNTVSIASWDHTQDVPGPLSDPLLVSSPSLPTAVPEPPGAFLMSISMLLLIYKRIR